MNTGMKISELKHFKKSYQILYDQLRILLHKFTIGVLLSADTVTWASVIALKDGKD